MRKSLLVSMLLLMLSSMVIAQERVSLLYMPFRSSTGLVGNWDDQAFGWTMTGPGMVGNFSQYQIIKDLGMSIWTIGETNPSEGYPGASGTSYTEPRTNGFACYDVNAEGYRNIWFSYGIRGAGAHNNVNVDYSDDNGKTWKKLSDVAGDVEVTAGANQWNLITYKKPLPASKMLAIKVTVTGSWPPMDDFKISAETDAGAPLRIHIAQYEAEYNLAVEGLELGQYLAGAKAPLRTQLDAAIDLLQDENYLNSAAYAADQALVAAYNTFAAKKITTANAPKINKVADQPFSFSNQVKTINLSGIGATSGGGALTVTVRSLNGKCAPSVTYTSGATGVLTYTGVAGNYGQDRIIVTVEQANQSAAITKKIEMSFAVEVLDASVNIPPVINAVVNQYVYNNEGTKNIQLTGIDAVNPGQTVTVTAVSDKPSVIPNPTVGAVSNGNATLTYTPAAGQSGKVKITLTVKDNRAGTTSGNDTTTLEFFIVVWDSANPPAMFDTPAGAQGVIMNSGENVFYLSNMRNINRISTGYTFEILQGGNLIETPVINYQTGQYFALLKVQDKGLAGTVKIRVFLDDYPQEIELNIHPFSNPGISLEIYDIVFWQQTVAVAVNASPIYSEVVNDTRFPPQADAFWTGKWPGIHEKWTVGADCTTGACQPAPYINLGTDGFKGFFVPQTSGNYTFSFAVGSDFNGGIWMDTTCTSWKDAKPFAVNSNATKKGTISGNKVTSESLYLTAGRVYPFYVTRWFVHHVGFDVRYTGPGVSSEVYIPKELLAPIYDIEKPQAPANAKLITTKDKSIVIAWDAVKSGRKVAKVKGYNVYANGVKKNASLLTDIEYEVQDLTPSRGYNVFVTAVDELGNESMISDVVTTETFPESVTAPGKVTTIKQVGRTGETLKVTWTKGAAPGSKIVAYDVYVNDVKYNEDYYFYTDTVFIRGLQPETSYKIEVVAYNASMVGSGKSNPQNISTAEFDPNSDLGLQFGEYRVRLNVEKKNISWTEGVGINGGYKGGWLSDALRKGQTDRLKPGIVRWGALDANVYGFNSVSGSGAGDNASSIGVTRKNKGLATHASNMNYCNQIGSLYSLCVGTKNGTGGLSEGEQSANYRVDYIGTDGLFDPQTFLNLIEYLAGPATSTWGKVRALEGFTDPVLDPAKSKGVIIELGNEVWGGVAHNAPIGVDYEKYGQSCRAVAEAVKQSPYWENIKDIVWFKYSARNADPQDSYGLNEKVVKGHKGEVSVFGPGGYIGPGLTYNPEMEYGETIAQYYRQCGVNVKKNLHGLLRNMQNQIQEGGVPLHSYFYETNITTSSYFGKLGQAIFLGDFLTSALKNGAITPAIFTLEGGEWRITIGATELAHYSIAQLINTYCKGHLVKTSVDTNNTLRAGNNVTPVLDFDPVGTSVYNNGENWSIMLFSRDFAHDYSVQLNLPSDIGTITNAKMFVVKEDKEKTAGLPEEESGVNVMANYERTEENVTLKNGQVVYVPKASVVLFTFKANDPGFTKLPLANYDYVKATGLEVEPADGYTLDITARNGSTRLVAKVTPEDAFVTKNLYVGESNAYTRHAQWSLDPADNPSLHPSMSYPAVSMTGVNFTVRANNNVCNGTYYVRATLAENPSISVLTPINITGQSCDISVDNPDAEQVSSVYPNPTADVLYVKTSSSDKMATVNVYNTAGARVMAEKGYGELFELDVRSLAAGTYFVTVDKDGKQETITFIKK